MRHKEKYTQSSRETEKERQRHTCTEGEVASETIDEVLKEKGEETNKKD